MRRLARKEGYRPRHAAGHTSRATLLGRAAMVATAAVLGATLVSAGAYATFTTATTTSPNSPSYVAGVLSAPSPLSCAWASASNLGFTWTNTSGTFASGYDLERSATSGSGYTVKTSTTSATTAADTAPPSAVTGTVPSAYYVAQSKRGTWTSAFSNEMASPDCAKAVSRAAGQQGVSLYLGSVLDGYADTTALFDNPNGVAFDTTGNMYIVDTNHQRIRKVDATTRLVSTIVGTGAAATTTACTYTGAGASLALNGPVGIDVDKANNVLYLVDTGSNCVRKVNLATNAVSPFAGSGGASTACNVNGSAGGTNPTTIGLLAPTSVTVLGTSVYISDTFNNCIWKVTGATWTPYAGAGGGAGSPATCSWAGAASQSVLSTPTQLAFDASGNGYLADTGHNCVRKITTGSPAQIAGYVGSGTAGTAACSYTGTAPDTTTMTRPSGVAVDSSNNVFVSSDTAHCIIRVATGTKATSNTAFASATAGFAGGGWAPAGIANGPTHLTFDASGNLYVGDTNNEIIRKIVSP